MTPGEATHGGRSGSSSGGGSGSPVSGPEAAEADLAATVARVRAMDLRIRIERMATEAYHRVRRTPNDEFHTEIKARLVFLLAGVPAERFHDAYGLVRLGRHVYEQTSDVLHGRIAMVNLPDVVVDEWVQVVDRLDDLHRRTTGTNGDVARQQ